MYLRKAKKYRFTMKSFLRFLSRNKAYAFIEAIGLVVSLAFVVIFGSYAYQQYSINTENPDRENIYAFGMPDCIGLTYGFPDALKSRVPEVVRVTSIIPQTRRFRIGESAVNAEVMGTDKAFFDIFPYYGFVSGSPSSLDAKDNILISETFAAKHSLKVGDQLSIDGNELMISGIVKDFKATLISYCDIIASNKSNLYSKLAAYDNFGNVITFAQVAPGTDRQVLYDKAEAVCKDVYEYYGKGFFEKLKIWRVDEIYFSKDWGNVNQGDLGTLRLLSLAGLLLLLCAIFNYINLNFALVGKRAKEMATRRLVGEQQSGVIWRYIAESVLFTAVCFVFALLMAVAMAPTMNNLLGNPVAPITIEFKPAYIAGFVLLTLLTGTLSGLLPALFASRFRPIDIVRGSFRTSNKMVFSKIFIVLQCAFSVFLISMALVMEAQYGKSLKRPKNYDSAEKIYMYTFGSKKPDMSLADILRELPCVERIGFSQGCPAFFANGQYSTTLDGKDILYRICWMDSTAFSMLNFRQEKNFGAPMYNSVWFSQTAFRATGLDDSHLQIDTLTHRAIGCEQLAGVFQDIPLSIANEGERMNIIVSVIRDSDMWWPGLLIETKGDHGEAMNAIRQAFEKWNDTGMEEIYTLSYLDDAYKDALKPALDNMRLLEMFMLISIMISLLGLIAMSGYFADERAHDIAIRKVFGGTVESELAKNVVDYMIMVLIACVIGVPVAVWASRKYLESFIDRISGYAWIFVVAVAISLAISFLSVFWQTLSAARTNPADELR